MAGLAADQDAAHRPGRADAHSGVAALDLERRGVGQVGAVAFAGVDHQQARGAGGIEHRTDRRDRGAEPRHVIAERLAEAARLQEIALHVDDDERGAAEIDHDRLRLRQYRDPSHGTPPVTPPRAS